jgi:hypothetical protein
MHVYKGTNNKLIHIFQLQNSITIYLVYICCNFFYRCLLLQVDNLNLGTNLENYGYYAMIIACKCTPLCKKLDCDAKNEPPYLTTTPLSPSTFGILSFPIYFYKHSQLPPLASKHRPVKIGGLKT